MGVGASGIRPPSGPAVSDNHAGRITDLERKRPLNDRPDTVQFEVPWAWSGDVTATTTPRIFPRWSARLKEVVFSLDTAGSSDSTFKVYSSGAALTPVAVDSNMSVVGTTLTLTASNQFGKAQFDVLFTKDVDYLQVEVVTVGTGAADLTVQSRFG